MNKNTRVSTPLLGALLLAAAPAVMAAEQVTPGAGSILQQIQPVTPPAPSSNGTGLSIESDKRSNLQQGAPFQVKSIQVTGNTVFTTATLHALVASAEGKNINLYQLEQLAGLISDYYHKHGYPLARAIIPAQTIEAGTVQIRVIEARYGKITLDNHSRVSDGLLQATLSSLKAGQEVSQAPLDHDLLLLSDIPGVASTATLKPGDSVGTSDLQVDTSATAPLRGSVALDNYGNRYTGAVRLAGTLDVIDPLHHGDVLSLSGLTSGSDLYYGNLGYEFLLNGAGTRLGASYSALHYILGDTLETLEGHGTAQVESLWAKQPLVRSRDLNLYAQLEYDHKQLDDDIDIADLRTDRHLDNLTLSLGGDVRDALLGGGINTWNVGWTAGRVDFDDAAAQQNDALTAKTQGSFSKWTANAFRLQSLSASNALYVTVSAQWASGNLDPSEKMVAGGPYTVRAYDMGVESGDTGILGSVEFRHDLGHLVSGQLQAVAFVDGERVNVDRHAFVAGENGATLSGAGLGLNWTGPNQWHARLYVAVPVGPTPDLIASNKSAHAWAEIGKGF
ncbi:MAG: ShlB/FhaC/HecB family hemolysin secretion/activation protein [Steroidobacteraceae bacterium]|jgi:hemolysin activation/secretion protein